MDTTAGCFLADSHPLSLFRTGLSEKEELSDVLARLGKVESGLDKMLHDRSPGQEEIDMLRWAGDLWGQMDWNSKQYDPIAKNEIAYIASKLRPLFLGKVEELGIPLTGDYSRRAYTSLRFFDAYQMNSGELSQVRELFHQMHQEISQSKSFPKV